MNRTIILKGLAICSSVLLAGCFVAYRQNQASAPSAPDEVPVMPGSKSKVILPNSKNIDAILAKPGQQRTSEDFIIPADPEAFRESGEKEPVESGRGKTLLPSSKNIDAILLNPSRQNNSLPPANPKSTDGKDDKSSGSGKGKTLLPSSKIGAILTPKDVAEEMVEPAPDAGQKEKP